MNATKLPEYDVVVDALEEVLSDLPGKIIAIGGMPASGKTTLGRFLAWNFNVSLLETDLFLEPANGRIAYREAEIARIIQFRLQKPRPIIVEGALILRLLENLGIVQDFLIQILCETALNDSLLKVEMQEYVRQYSPATRANITISLTHPD